MYSVLINTCDKFEDCWYPFFKLWSIYWKDCSGKIYLNTEYKEFAYPGLDIIPVKSCAGKCINGTYATWSQCFRWALEIIDTDIVLYMQEDYFLNAVVDNIKVEEYVNNMIAHPEIPCIQLTSAGIPVGDMAEASLHLNYGKLDRSHYVSCQASLWRKDVLQDLIRDHETAWNFEWYGSKRAICKGYKFLTVNHEWLRDGNSIIPYIVTGVIGGKWNKPVVSLFQKNDIKINFSKRGFFVHNKKKSIAEKILFKFHFVKIKSEFELLTLKWKYWHHDS